MDLDKNLEEQLDKNQDLRKIRILPWWKRDQV